LWCQLLNEKEWKNQRLGERKKPKHKKKINHGQTLRHVEVLEKELGGVQTEGGARALFKEKGSLKKRRRKK